MHWCLKPALTVAIILSSGTVSAKYEGKKILYIDSYHEGYDWSDGITRGVKSVVAKSSAELKVIRLDTKNHPEEAFRQEAGKKAKEVIEQFKPDVVIVSDDNATKYVLKEYFKDARIPFVHAGINWDSSTYGLPYKNTTGMIEVASYPMLVLQLKPFAKGTRIGILEADTETERKEVEGSAKKFAIKYSEIRFAKDFKAWKDAYLELQDKVDMVFLINNAGITDWNIDEAKDFVAKNAKIPSGTVNTWMMPYCIIGYTKIPDEFGIWAAEQAFKILDGARPASIPETTNSQAKIIVNMQNANKLNVVFKPEFLKNAEVMK